MKDFLLYIWQLPQNLLGLLLLLIYQKDKLYHQHNGRKFYYTPEMPSGISLGDYIIMDKEDHGEGMWHEYGHSIDSHRFGPLYLPTIGLCSICVNIWDRLFHKKWKTSDRLEWYYSKWSERRADQNGGVDRAAYIEWLRNMGY